MITHAELLQCTISKGALRLVLRRHGACKEGLDFVKGKNLVEAWRTCQQGSLMRWFLYDIVLNSDPNNAARRQLQHIDSVCNTFCLLGISTPTKEQRLAAVLRSYFGFDGRQLRPWS